MALLFVGIIMMALFSTLISLMRTYNKGVWMSQINQAGRQINTDIGEQARFSSSPTYQSANNRLCVGNVTYIWNTNQDIKNGNVKNWYSGEAGLDHSQTSLRLVRVVDPAGTFCNNASTMPERNSENVSSLLGVGVTVQEFAVAASGNLLKVQAVFSTDGDVQPKKMDDGTWQCVQQDGTFSAANNQYCAYIDLDLVVFGRGK